MMRLSDIVTENKRRIASLALMVATIVFFGSAQCASAFRNLTRGEVVPAFSLGMQSGGVVEFAPPPEVLIVMAFVKQGHDKCEEVMADLQKIDPVIAEKIQVLAILTNPGEGDSAEWLQKTGAKFPLLLDKEGAVYGLYGTMVTPQVAIIGPDGKFIDEIGGHTASFGEQLDKILREALGMEEKVDESAAVAEEIPEARKLAMREVAKAHMLIKRKMKSKAMPQVDKALENDPTYVEAHLMKADLLMEEENEANLAEAETHYKKAEELDAGNHAAKIGLARVAAGRGDTAGAVETLEKAAMISPKPERLYYYLGQLHEKANDLPKAVDAYKKALAKLLEDE